MPWQCIYCSNMINKRLLLSLVILKRFPNLFVFSEFVPKQSEANQLELHNKLLTEQLAETKNTSVTLTKTLEETQNQNKVFEII